MYWTWTDSVGRLACVRLTIVKHAIIGRRSREVVVVLVSYICIMELNLSQITSYSWGVLYSWKCSAFLEAFCILEVPCILRGVLYFQKHLWLCAPKSTSFLHQHFGLLNCITKPATCKGASTPTEAIHNEVHASWSAKKSCMWWTETTSIVRLALNHPSLAYT